MVEIEGVVACTSRFVLMKEHVPFGREFIILCIRYRVVVDRFSNFKRKQALKDSFFLMGSIFDP